MLNKVILMGRLTRDPEVKTTQGGVNVCTFTLAVDRNYTKQGEERKADFINIVAWRQTADFIARFFRKGQLVAVSGSLQTRTWDDQNGNKRYATEVIAEDAYFAEPKREGESAPQGGYGGQNGGYNNGGFNGGQQGGGFNGGDSGIPGFSPVTGDDDLPF